MIINSENIWNAIDELDTNAIILVDALGIIRKMNKGVTALLGFSEYDIIGKGIEILMPADVKKLHRTRFANYVEQRKREVESKSKLIGVQRTFPGTIVNDVNEPIRFSIKHKNQMEVPVNLTINEVWSDSEELVGFIAILLNNTEQYNLQQQLQFNATHDHLTGLLNWQEFVSEVHATKKRLLHEGTDSPASLLFLNVDYFKTINYHSQKAGDYALKEIANWLLNQSWQKQNRPKDIIASRFLSDEFILYLPATPLEGALTLANRLKAEFKKLNLRTTEKPFFTSVSIGATQVTLTTKLQDAVSQASHACNTAKDKGKDKIEVAQEDAFSYLHLEPVIREAVMNQRLMLYAQKIVAISPRAKSIDKNRAHYEVLSRMEDKQGNFISPMVSYQQPKT